MMMKRLVNHLVVTIFVPLLALSSWASYDRSSAELFSIQAQMEDLLTRRFTYELSTRMSKDFFTVSAQVQLAPKAEVDEPLSESEELPPELMLGDLSPERMGLGSIDKSSKSSLTKYSISKVVVSVGMKSSAPQSLLRSTEEWLTERLRKEYGKNAEGEVSVIEAVPAVEPPATGGSGLSKLFKDLREYQQLMGQILLGLALILAAWQVGRYLAASSKSEGASATVNVTGGAAGSSSSGAGGAGGSKGGGLGDGEKGDVSGDPVGSLAVSQVAGKVLQLAAQLPVGMSQLVKGWVEEGDSGLLKLACLLEMVSGASVSVDVPESLGDELLPQLEKLSSLSKSEKVRIEGRVYWDMVSFKTVGAGALFRPFSFLNRLKQEEVRSLVMQQNSRMKALVALSMPDQSRQEFVGKLSSDERKKLIEDALSVDFLREDEIREAEASLRVDKPVKLIKTVETQPSLIKLLKSMPVRDEIAILSEMSVSNPDLTSKLKLNYPSLAFFEQWSDAVILKVLDGLSGDELFAYLTLKPQMEERLLNLCPATLGEIVREDRAANRMLSDEQLDQFLSAFQSRITASVNNGLVKLANVWNSEVDEASQKQDVDMQQAA